MTYHAHPLKILVPSALFCGFLLLYGQFRRMFLSRKRAGKVSGLACHPLRGGTSLVDDMAECGAQGLVMSGVRDGEFIVARPMTTTDGAEAVVYMDSALRDIKPYADGASLTLTSESESYSIRISLDRSKDDEKKPKVKIQLDGQWMQATDCGEGAAKWLSKHLSEAGLRLYRVCLKDQEKTAAYTFHVEESQREIIKMFRLRLRSEDSSSLFPFNVRVSGSTPLDESCWDVLHVGTTAVFKRIGPALRLTAPVYDKTTCMYRYDGEPHPPLCDVTCVPAASPAPTLGAYVTVLVEGQISVGDPVYVTHRTTTGFSTWNKLR